MLKKIVCLASIVFSSFLLNSDAVGPKKKRCASASTTFITEIGKFSPTGEVESFKKATDQMSEYVENKLTPQMPIVQRYETYKVISSIVKMAGLKNFMMREHYESAKRLVDKALVNEAKFNEPKITYGLKKLKVHLDSKIKKINVRMHKKIKHLAHKKTGTLAKKRTAAKEKKLARTV